MMPLRYTLFAITTVTAVTISLLYIMFSLSLNAKTQIHQIHVTTKEFILPVKQQERLSPVNQHTTGYVLALSYLEQQTSGSRNLFNLQCWAGQFNAGLKVVEPFMSKSHLVTPLSKNNSGLKFSDLNDLALWNNHSRAMNYSQLVSWEKFLNDAPRQVIVVNFKHGSKSGSTKTRKDVKLHVHSQENPVRYKSGCSPFSHDHKLLNEWNFQIVREVCFNFMYGDELTMEQFSSDVYGKILPSNVTVVFSQWRSFGLATTRILVSDSHCKNTYFQERIIPGQAIQEDAEKYIAKYLKGNRYIATMIRMEKTIIKFLSENPNVVHKSFDLVIKYWKEIKITTKLEENFISIDIGKYGSESMSSNDKKGLTEMEFPQFFEQIYGKSISVAEWEHTFEDVARSHNSAYIAMLQMWLVSKADCAIFIGGGSFQSRALYLYQHNHPIEQCYEVIDIADHLH